MTAADSLGGGRSPQPYGLRSAAAPGATIGSTSTRSIRARCARSCAWRATSKMRSTRRGASRGGDKPVSSTLVHRFYATDPDAYWRLVKRWTSPNLRDGYGLPLEALHPTLERDPLCVYCWIALTPYKRADPSARTIEHFLNEEPWGDASNVGFCCNPCNSNKKAKLLRVWFAEPYCRLGQNS